MKKAKKENKLLSIIITAAALLVIASTLILLVANALLLELKSYTVIDLLEATLDRHQLFKQTDLGHQIGQRDKEPDSREGVVYEVEPLQFKNSGENYLVLGPGVIVFPGKYSISFEIAGEDLPPNLAVAIIDVFSLEQGVVAERTIESKELSNDFQKLGFNFQTEGGDKFEFRVCYLGRGKIRVRNIEIRALNLDFKMFFKKVFKLIKDKIN